MPGYGIVINLASGLEDIESTLTLPQRKQKEDTDESQSILFIINLFRWMKWIRFRPSLPGHFSTSKGIHPLRLGRRSRFIIQMNRK